MKKVKVVCDICRSENAKEYIYSTGKSMDPSGNGYEDQWMHIDLCMDCFQDWVLKNKKKLYESRTNNL